MVRIATRKVRVWDLPTRLFHWALALGVVGMVVTAKIGGGALEWHARIGYAVGALLAFRILWGFAGGHWSRFAQFPPSLRAAWRYARGGAPHPAHGAGHNPLGSLSVYAMLLVLLAQVASGLFAQTKDDFAGPLSALVSNGTARSFTGYHKIFGEWAIYVLVGLHLAAVAWHAWRGRGLVGPMLTGDAEVDATTPPSRDDPAVRWRALALLALCGLGMWGLLQLGH